MSKKICVLLSFFILLSYSNVLACDATGCVLARSNRKDPAQNRPWFLDLTMEQQNWDKMDARGAHNLHHQGHHVHNKTHEEYYHFTLGANPSECWTMLLELPYVVKESIEIHDHARLGAKEQSEGIGDASLTGVYRIFRKNESFAGPLFGLKIPTGGTRETNSGGDRFEAELQPGSGSYDYRAGIVFGTGLGWADLHGNAVYTFKTEGAQDFEFGDTFSSYLFLDSPLGAKNDVFETRVGLDMNIQIQDKQADAGVEIADSGGTTLLLGPSLHVKTGESLQITMSFLFPAYQDLGGVHQELDFVWNAGMKASW